MTAKILTLDIETLPAVVERFDLRPSYTPIDMVIDPVRVLCFAAKFHDKPAVKFHAAWGDDDQDAYRAMAEAAWNLLDQADVVCGWNSTKFDLKHLNAMFGRLEMGPPSPYRSLDLYQVAKKNFNEMSMKLDWFSREWLDDRKLKHAGIALWQSIRRGDDEQKAKAQRVMRKYNIKDVLLTEKLLERFLPWTGINFALYGGATDAECCPKCESTQLHKRGHFYTTTYAYQRYRCNNCGGWSRGRRSVYTTELRPV